METKELKVKVKDVSKIQPDVFLLSFDCPYLAKNSYPGQFLHIKVKKVILRRPFSIHNVKNNTVYILFRVRGRGTAALAQYKKGDSLNILGPLGRGFSYPPDKVKDATNLLIAGGLGVAPLMFLATKLKKYKPIVILGEKSKKDILCEKEFKTLGCKVYISTDDGSRGTKGNVVDVLKKIKIRGKVNMFSCGPQAMFKKMNEVIKKKKDVNCEISFEQFMGCGIGTCCGCTIETKNGYKKVCKDGPVFKIKEIWK